MLASTRIAIAAIALAAAARCGKGNGQSDDQAGGEPRGELLVFAAASLTDAFNDLAKAFESAHPAVDVKLNFAGSQSLRTQIENGAQPQVFASANEQHMASLRERGLVDEPVLFAHNELVVVVPATNPAGIESLEQLPNADRIVLAGENVPAGMYAETMLANASSAHGADFARRVMAKVVSRETHVRQTLQKVALGEADAAIVYATDAASVGDQVKTIAIPRELNAIASYPIATVSGAPNARVGRLFVDFVRSEAAKTALRARGFQPAEAAVVARPGGE